MSIVSVHTPSNNAGNRKPETLRRMTAVGSKIHAKEPWFVLNRTAYQTILNMALAEMTSSLPTAMNDRSTMSSVDRHTTGSELLRLLRTEDEFISSTQCGIFANGVNYANTMSDGLVAIETSRNQKSPSVTILRQPNVVLNRSFAPAGQQGRVRNCRSSSPADFDEVENLTSSGRMTVGGLANVSPMTNGKSKNGYVRDDKHVKSDDENLATFFVGEDEMVSVKAEVLNDVSKVLVREPSPQSAQRQCVGNKHKPIGEITAAAVDADEVNLPAVVKDEPRSPSSCNNDRQPCPVGRSEMVSPTSSGIVACSDGQSWSSNKPCGVDSSQNNSEESQRSLTASAADDRREMQAEVAANWISIDKNVVATIVDHHLSVAACRHDTPPPFPVSAASFHQMEHKSAPSHSVSRLLASLLYSDDLVDTESSVPPHAIEPMQQHCAGKPTFATGAFPCSSSNNNNSNSNNNSCDAPKTRPSLLTSMNTCGFDEPIAAKRFRKSESAPEKSTWSPPQSRVHVRSTWSVPATGRRRAVTSTSLNSDLVSSSRPRRGVQRLPSHVSLFNSVSSAAAVVQSTLARNTSRPTSVSGSQVWTAIDKNVLQSVIDHLLSEDDDENVDVEEAAVDLTVVRPPKSPLKDSTCTSGSGLHSNRDLIALISSVSFGNRTHQSVNCSTHRRPDVAKLYRTRNDIDYDVISSGDGCDAAAVKFKWKSNIMQRMHREQLHVTSSPMPVAATSSGCVWR